MKKLIIIPLAFLVLILAGCSGSDMKKDSMMGDKTMMEEETMMEDDMKKDDMMDSSDMDSN